MYVNIVHTNGHLIGMCTVSFWIFRCDQHLLYVLIYTCLINIHLVVQELFRGKMYLRTNG